MFRRRSFWVYSLGLAVVWAFLLIGVFLFKGQANGQVLLLVFGGFCLGWISTTIARYIYPPAKRWNISQTS